MILKALTLLIVSSFFPQVLQKTYIYVEITRKNRVYPNFMLPN